MGRIVGIDLGTTYSAVAIPEERSGKGFLTVPQCPGCSMILDRLKRRTIPSVVAEDDKGQIVVGHSAKGRAGLTPEPIMFAKRYMGEDKTFQLDRQGALQPEDVSAHILRHIKELAEEQLGEQVDEAVITVPAYFKLRAKQLTEEAGKKAGLKVRLIAQEPVAAAVMYCAKDTRDPLRIMTYDLGGGTFDVAILEKRDGTISSSSILAFDGDRMLGGYNFDRTLAHWLIDQLNEQGYRLDPDDAVTFAKLMVYAERAKLALSRDESYTFQEPNTGITDADGNDVVIELGITREEFEAMIGSQVDYTLAICERALTEKPGRPIGRDEIDEIIMVGGSSFIPLVQRRLEERFGRRPQLVEPNLCVALGAAILAGMGGASLPYLNLDNVPAQTDLHAIAVTGSVVVGDDLGEVEGCTVRLKAQDGSINTTRKTGPDGAFVFDNVSLAPDDETAFLLTVVGPVGKHVAEHRFSVTQTQDPTAITGGLTELGGPPTQVLAKPIYVLMKDGPNEIAPERSGLPFEVVVPAQRGDASHVIRVPIMEGNNPLGELVVPDVPDTLAVGSDVEIKVTIQENYRILARAYVPSLAREERVEIEIPPPPKKSTDELRREFEQLLVDKEDALSAAGRGALFADAKVAMLNERVEQCKRMLQLPQPDPFEIQDCLDEIRHIIRDLSAGWRPDPPKASFDQKSAEAETLLQEAIQAKPEVAKDGYDGRLGAIRSEADKAYADQNTAAWKESFKKIMKLCDELASLKGSGGGGGAPPDPKKLVVLLGRDLDALKKQAEDQGRYPQLKDQFREAADSLEAIDPNSSDALTQIRDWYITKLGALRETMGEGPPDASDEGLTRLRKRAD